MVSEDRPVSRDRERLMRSVSHLSAVALRTIQLVVGKAVDVCVRSTEVAVTCPPHATLFGEEEITRFVLSQCTGTSGTRCFTVYGS